jgi:hypothetical protein
MTVPAGGTPRVVHERQPPRRRRTSGFRGGRLEDVIACKYGDASAIGRRQTNYWFSTRSFIGVHQFDSPPSYVANGHPLN